MFTGLVEAMGTVVRLVPRGPSARALVRCALGSGEPLALGESIAVSGACLTVDALTEGGFEADLSAETLAKTTLGALVVPAAVNLERAAKLGSRMGGHVVLGHVDGVGRLAARTPSGDAVRATFEVGRELAHLIATKGSITIDGVSLTVNDVADRESCAHFSLMLVPHTLGRTTLSELRIDSRVNIEIDVLARYVERQLGMHSAQEAAAERGLEHGTGDHDDERLLEKLRRGGYV